MHLLLEQRINAPADSVWQVLGTQFADIAEWATFVKSSRAISQKEVPASFTVPAAAPVPGRETMTKVKVVEVITAFSDEDRSLTFEGTGLPRIIRRAQDIQSVAAEGENTSTVTFEIDFDFVGPFAAFSPILRRRMTKTFGGILVDLKQHVEAAN
ncbi:MAG: hypothetical protein GY720_13485 [bacterium]|nr:hypothetical protein [bacterium]